MYGSGWKNRSGLVQSGQIQGYVDREGTNVHTHIREIITGREHAEGVAEANVKNRRTNNVQAATTGCGGQDGTTVRSTKLGVSSKV